MLEIYEKINDNTLKVTNNDTNIHIFEESRVEIETKLFHLKADKDKMERDFQDKIKILEAKIAILDEE